jgi:hypothetical protein
MLEVLSKGFEITISEADAGSIIRKNRPNVKVARLEPGCFAKPSRSAIQW